MKALDTSSLLRPEQKAEQAVRCIVRIANLDSATPLALLCLGGTLPHHLNVMPKKISKQEMAYEFCYALATDLAVAESLLSKHPDLIDHPVFGKSESALHFYATENQLEIVTWLIDHGANPKGIAEDDYPLIAASQLGHKEVCQALLGAGANPNLSDSVGETALHKASGNGHLDIIELLLDSGADPSIAEMCGELPVEQALPRKSEQVKAIFDRHTATIQPRHNKQVEAP